jgi:hypothetical protein
MALYKWTKLLYDSGVRIRISEKIPTIIFVRDLFLSPIFFQVDFYKDVSERGMIDLPCFSPVTIVFKLGALRLIYNRL